MVEESTAASHGLARESDELAKVIEGFDVGCRNVKPQSLPRPAAAAPSAKFVARKIVGGPPRPAADAPESWNEF
jgi:methyl-accepting chemotaxis protein